MSHQSRVLTQTGAVRAWWSLLMVLVAAVLVAAACVVYTAHSQRQADRRWCSLLVAIDAPGQPPTTARGVQVQQAIHRLRVEFGCKGA